MSDTVPRACQTPIIDTSLGLLSTGGDPDLLSELVSIFLQTVPAQLERMKAAIATGDNETARREAHSLKGAAGALGAAGIQRLAADIEVLAAQGNLETAQPMLELIARLVSQLEQEYAAKNPLT